MKNKVLTALIFLVTITSIHAEDLSNQHSNVQALVEVGSYIECERFGQGGLDNSYFHQNNEILTQYLTKLNLIEQLNRPGFFGDCFV